MCVPRTSANHEAWDACGAVLGVDGKVAVVLEGGHQDSHRGLNLLRGGVEEAVSHVSVDLQTAQEGATA